MTYESRCPEHVYTAAVSQKTVRVVVFRPRKYLINRKVDKFERDKGNNASCTNYASPRREKRSKKIILIF